MLADADARKTASNPFLVQLKINTEPGTFLGINTFSGLFWKCSSGVIAEMAKQAVRT